MLQDLISGGNSAEIVTAVCERCKFYGQIFKLTIKGVIHFICDLCLRKKLEDR